MKVWKNKKMKLSDVFKQFKNIQPDADFSRRSRTEILLSPQNERRTMRGVFAFLHVIETGAAVALVGFFILILTGSFSPTRSIAPIQYAVIDPAGLHAEAQAIDMQIQLADIVYPQVTSTAVATPAVSVALTEGIRHCAWHIVLVCRCGDVNCGCIHLGVNRIHHLAFR